MGSVRRGTERVTARDVAVCVDTGVLTSTLRIGSPLEARYRRHLTGRRLVIATQVVAEARYGALRAGWRDRASVTRQLSHASVRSHSPAERIGLGPCR